MCKQGRASFVFEPSVGHYALQVGKLVGSRILLLCVSCIPAITVFEMTVFVVAYFFFL